jgi:hypothetical protein
LLTSHVFVGATFNCNTSAASPFYARYCIDGVAVEIFVERMMTSRGQKEVCYISTNRAKTEKDLDKD